MLVSPIRKPAVKRRQRRRLRKCTYSFGGAIVMMVLTNAGFLPMFSIPDTIYIQNPSFSFSSSSSSSSSSSTSASPPHQIVIKNAAGDVISRNSSQLLQFFADEEKRTTVKTIDTSIINMTLKEAQQGRERVLSILKDAGIEKFRVAEILKLPTWDQISAMYGSKPILVGTNTCQTFREQVPKEHRFMGVAGTFNSGSTAFALSLQANCRFPNHSQNMSNHVISDVNGMLNQVPWAKHKMAMERYNHTIQPNIPNDHVLPIVLIRDPWYWMHSMCRQGYGVRWDHDPDKHCPNLVPNDYDRRRFKKKLKEASSVPVWMGANPKTGPSWPSLVHYWNDWYQSYSMANFPRLMIRFEDTLFHGREVMKQVCECGGGVLWSSSRQHKYLVDEAKWDHKHVQNNWITAMIQYGTDAGRYHNMTTEDLEFAKLHLDASLLQLFQYHVTR